MPGNVTNGGQLWMVELHRDNINTLISTYEQFIIHLSLVCRPCSWVWIEAFVQFSIIYDGVVILGKYKEDLIALLDWKRKRMCAFEILGVDGGFLSIFHGHAHVHRPRLVIQFSSHSVSVSYFCAAWYLKWGDEESVNRVLRQTESTTTCIIYIRRSRGVKRRRKRGKI